MKSSACTVPVKRLKSDCNGELTGIFQTWIMKNFFNFEGVTEFVWEKTTIYFSEQLSFHRKLTKFQTHARSCAP